jgi:hypothetical protein
MKVLGVTTVNALRQLNHRLSHRRVKRCWMGGPAGSDFAFLVERELFAQEEILGRERALRSETEHQKAEQIGKQVQPKQAEFYHAPRSLVLDLLPSKASQFSPFKSRR